MAPNPNPARITGESWRFMEELLKLEPGSRNGGIFASKPGYHNTRANNSPLNYSVQLPADRRGPSDKSAGYDWTFPDAQAGRYATIIKYSRRLLDSGRDPDDPRLDGWREFYGQADTDMFIEGWDFQRGLPAISDPSHLWHIHLSELRENVGSWENKQRMLSVLRGETVAQWRGHDKGEINMLNVTLPKKFAYDLSSDNIVDKSAIVTLAAEWSDNSTWLESLGKASVSFGTHWSVGRVLIRVEFAVMDSKGKTQYPRQRNVELKSGQSFDWLHLPKGAFGVSAGLVTTDDTDLVSNVDMSLIYGVKS